MLRPNAFWHIRCNTVCKQSCGKYKYFTFRPSYLAMQFHAKQPTFWQYALPPPPPSLHTSNVPVIIYTLGSWKVCEMFQCMKLGYISTLISWVLTGAVCPIHGVSRITRAVVSSISIDTCSIMMTVVYILHTLIDICTIKCLWGTSFVSGLNYVIMKRMYM